MTPGRVAAVPLGDRALLLRFGEQVDAATHRRVTAAREAIAAAQPRDLDALSAIPGIGAKKLERYGPALLELLRNT